MEDLQNLMACIDEIASQIPDGMYLKMADQMKRVHDHMNGNKPIHEDTFYYSDDDSEFESDDDSDSDFEVPTVENRRLRERAYQKLKDEIFGLVKQMHAEYKVLKKWDKETRREWTPIKRMTTWRKGQAIMTWCDKTNKFWTPTRDSRELVCGCTDQFAFWTWEKLTEYGMKMIVFEIGTEAEKVSVSRGFICQDDLSLKTLQKLPAFEKQIYEEYKEESHRKWNSCVEDAKKKVKESEEKMNTLEKACREREYLIGGFLCDREWRDYWDLDTYVFTTGRTVL
jgi:hypothetical protein